MSNNSLNSNQKQAFKTPKNFSKAKRNKKDFKSGTSIETTEELKTAEGSSANIIEEVETPNIKLNDRHHQSDDSIVRYTNNTMNNSSIQSPIPSSTPPPPNSICGNNNEYDEMNQSAYIMVPSNLQQSLNSTSSSIEYDCFSSPMMTMMSTPPSSVAYHQRYDHLNQVSMINDTSLLTSTTNISSMSSNEEFSNMQTPLDMEPTLSETPFRNEKSFNHSEYQSTNTTLNTSMPSMLNISNISTSDNQLSHISNLLIEQKLKELKHQTNPSKNRRSLPSSTRMIDETANNDEPIDTDRVLCTSRIAVIKSSEDVLKVIRQIQDPDDGVRRRAVSSKFSNSYSNNNTH